VAELTREGCIVGDLHLSDDVIARARARFEELAREVGIVVPVLLDATGSVTVVAGGEHAEQWYRGAAAMLMSRLEQAGDQVAEVAAAFDNVDRGLRDGAAS
jgi:hypothetical protein